MKVVKAAAQVLNTLWQYRDLRTIYKKVIILTTFDTYNHLSNSELQTDGKNGKDDILSLINQMHTVTLIPG